MLLELKGLSYTYPGETVPAFEGMDLAAGPGECHLVTGPTGSGKSTLALAVKGLLQGGNISGEMRLGSGLSVGIVLQNPETQLLCSSVGAEAAFGLENRAVEPRLMENMVRGALAASGLDMPLGFDCGKLSMGQKYRLLLASQLVMGHGLILLDEPAAQLDRRGVDGLCRTITARKREGVSFILLEHDANAFSSVVDEYHYMGQKPEPEDTGGLSKRPAHAESRHAPGTGRGPEAVSVRGLSADFGTGGGPVWSGAEFSVPRGRIAAISGENGTGKTTLLKCLTGLVRPAAGEFAVCGEKPDPRRMAGKVGVMFQDPHAQFFEDTVCGEVSFTPRRSGLRGSRLDDAVSDALRLCGIEHLAARSPHRLSYGQKRLVALACALAPGPELLLLDDPFAGLDRVRREGVMEILRSAAHRHGTAIVSTSHNPGRLGGWPDMEISIRGGSVVTRYG